MNLPMTTAGHSPCGGSYSRETNLISPFHVQSIHIQHVLSSIQNQTGGSEMDSLTTLKGRYAAIRGETVTRDNMQQLDEIRAQMRELAFQGTKKAAQARQRLEIAQGWEETR